MSDMIKLRLAYLKVSVLTIGCILNQSVQAQIKTETKPNVLFFLADDQREDALGCSGNPYIKTPNIDLLAENGIRFTNTYVMGSHHGAVCAPSRAMLMSGKSLFHVYDELDGVHTMPIHFAQNGYETFGTGKWHNGSASFEAGFQYGENVFIGGMSDHFNAPCRDMNESGKLNAPVNKSFSTDLFAEATLNFLNKYAEEEQENPFFCYVSFTAPHDPRSPHQDYVGMYKDETMPLPGNFKKYHPFDFGGMSIRDENLAPWPRTPEIIQASIADYYALISHIDDQVGAIINNLKKNNLYENTIIVYAADNGLGLGSHGLLGKQNLYEHSTKVPLIICGPGIPKKQQTEALAYLHDVFPSLSELCGLPALSGIDGKDLSPVIVGKSKGVRESLYTVYVNTIRAVRTDRWKLIYYPIRNHHQLFDLKNDPLELINLANDDAYQKKMNELKGLLKKWHTETDDTANLNPEEILPLQYEPEKFIQKADKHQPDYVLKKYFKGIE
jgi:arylsulfatase A-like enzyme